MRPGTDDKRLCSWNALMISALAEAGAVLGRVDWVDAAVSCAEFIEREMRCDGDGRGPLLRTYKDGRAHIDAYLEDYAYLLEALLTLYEASGRDALVHTRAGVGRRADRPLRRSGARRLPHHRADGGSGFARRKDLDDSPIPSGNSAAAFGLLRLARLSGESRYEQQALGVLRVVAPIVARHPLGFGHALRALDFELARVHEVAVVGSGADAEALLDVVRGSYRPHLVLAGGAGRRRRASGAAAARPPAGRRTRRRLRMRGIRLPRAGHRARRARRRPGLTSLGLNARAQG